MGGENVKITIQERLLTKIAPYPCLGCGFLADVLCPRCVNDIVDDMFFACWSCYRPSSSGVCDFHGTDDLVAFWISGWREGLLKRAIDSYKFSNIRRLALNLSKILDARLPVLPRDTVVVPLPTKNRSIRTRGYDHTFLIAKQLTISRGLQLSNSLVLARKSETQHFSGKIDRQSQIEGVFAAKIKEEDKNRPHLIVDDIVTTGATMLEAHKTLVTAGVEVVWLAALARQPLDEHVPIC